MNLLKSVAVFSIILSLSGCKTSTSSSNDIPPADTTVVSTTKLLALYRFNNNVIDSSGLGRNGTLTNGTFVPDRFNNARSALQFNGTSTMVTIPDAPDLNFGKSDNFSICYWYKNLDTGVLVHKGIGDHTSPFFGFRIAVFFGGDFETIGTTYGESVASGEMRRGDAIWHFAVYTFDRSGLVRYYEDGVEFFLPIYVSNPTRMAGNMDAPAPLVLGSDGIGSSFVKTTLDDVRIYKGLLTSDQVSSLYRENGW